MSNKIHYLILVYFRKRDSGSVFAKYIISILRTVDGKGKLIPTVNLVIAVYFNDEVS